LPLALPSPSVLAASFVPGIKEISKTIKMAFKAASDLAPPAPKAKAKPKAKPKAQNARVDTGVAHAKAQAKKDQDCKGHSVDKREFHAFLMSLVFYLELAEFFEICDGAHDDDQKLSCRECLKGKDRLAEWGVSEDMLREKFAGVDIWVPHMKFDDFAEWIMGFRWAAVTLKLDDSDDEEAVVEAGRRAVKESADLTFAGLGAESEMNMMKVTESFNRWDADGSGGISEEEMADVLKELNPEITDAKIKLLFSAADTNSDGIINIEEFCKFIFG